MEQKEEEDGTLVIGKRFSVVSTLSPEQGVAGW